MSIDKILVQLKDRGYRNSIPRRIVLEILDDHIDVFLTADEIYLLARKHNSKINRSTIYRIIEILDNENFIHKSTKKDGTNRIKLLCSGKHHHHMICDSCGKIIVYPKCDLEAYQVFAESHGFTLTGHILELHGICQKCYSKISSNVSEM